MQKEAGYDEFLAEKIRRGEEDLKAGRVISKEEMNAKMEKLFARLAEEQRLRDEQEFYVEVAYG